MSGGPGGKQGNFTAVSAFRGSRSSGFVLEVQGHPNLPLRLLRVAAARSSFPLDFLLRNEVVPTCLAGEVNELRGQSSPQLP